MTQPEDRKDRFAASSKIRPAQRGPARGCWLLLVCAAAAGCTSGGGGDDDGGDGDADSCDEASDDCQGETICMDGACEAAFGRRYRFSNLSVSIPDRNPDGESWDSLGGAPDPYIEVWLNQDELVLSTSAVDDVFDASYSDTGDATVAAGDSFFIDVWDEDLADPDPVYSCTADPIPADILRLRAAHCASDGYTVEVAITPR